MNVNRVIKQVEAATSPSSKIPGQDDVRDFMRQIGRNTDILNQLDDIMAMSEDLGSVGPDWTPDWAKIAKMTDGQIASELRRQGYADSRQEAIEKVADIRWAARICQAVKIVRLGWLDKTSANDFDLPEYTRDLIASVTRGAKILLTDDGEFVTTAWAIGGK